MPSAFYRTTRSLNLDHIRFPLLGVIVSCLFLSLWLCWALLFKISLYEISEEARIEVVSAVYPVQTPVTARLLRTNVSLGQNIQHGDTLFLLDSETLKLQLQEQESRRYASEREYAALLKSILAEETALQRERLANQTELEEAKSLFQEGNAAAQFAESEAQRLSQLFDQGLVSEATLQQAQANAEKLRASAEALRLKIDRLNIEHSIRQNDRQSHLEELRREAARVDGDRESYRKNSARLQQDIDYHVVRAPVDGTVGDMVELRPGSVVNVSQKLATIVPRGDNRIIANMPYAGIGRIRPGQSAEMRLDAFPWMQYGSLKATVSHVGSEPQNNRVRIELAIDDDIKPRFPIRHGLTGRIEVAVERITPAHLILRKLGEWINQSQERG